MTTASALARLTDKIRRYGKENLEDILHVCLEAAAAITRFNRSRIYLADLTSGTLSCVAAAGVHTATLRNRPFPLHSQDYLVSRVFASGEELQIEDLTAAPSLHSRELAEQCAIRSSYLAPLVAEGRAIGVICIDSSRPRQLPDEDARRTLREFCAGVATVINQARKYHQQVVLARRVDQAKSREAALAMMKSAVRLIDRLALAAVLVPAPLAPGAEEEGLQVLAAFSKEHEALRIYADDKLVDLGPGKSLMARFINRSGRIIDERLLAPLFFPHLEEQPLQKRYLTEELGLKSLYLVPRYDPETRRVICLVNYYTTGEEEFDDFEKGLLDEHAEMAERVIREIGSEHLEIQVLGEINDLLQENFAGPQPFLARVLSKVSELIGADTGSIALVQELDGERWLVVEEPDGRLVGAKSREWLKKNIPPIRVGGSELPPAERSLTGHAAHTGQPQIVSDTRGARPAGGFYREITEAVRSELAVPIVSDGEVLAVICLDSLRPHHFSDEHRRILLIIQRLIARQLFDLQRIERLTGEVDRLRSDVDYRDPRISSYKLGNIIGNSARSGEVIDFIQRVTPPLANRIAFWRRSALREATLGLPSILISGETGSGKEFLFNNLYSRLNAIYRESIDPQGELPVQKSNIAAYSGELTYSELFGHKRGAFTGAHADRKGILEEAHGGVVFLDEIGDADPKTQVQLLRFLDDGSFVRLGENVTRFARVVLVAATNRDLRDLIRQGTFREDLFHRLSELTVRIPSLNERREDIPDLAVHFLGRLWSIYKHPDQPESDAPSLTRAARQLLAAHHYSGNVRELRSLLLRAMLFASGRTIDAGDIRRALADTPVPPPATADKALQQAGTEAEEILSAIRRGETEFWSAIHQPYGENRLTREVVLELIQRARGEGATSMPRLARLLRACEPDSDDPEEQKAFYRFKNFLYKTIRLP